MQRNGLESGVPANFKGKKGRSGRYSVADEALKNRVKHRAWLMKEAKMNDQEAIQIVTKDMTVKNEFSGDLKINISFDGPFNTTSIPTENNPV